MISLSILAVNLLTCLGQICQKQAVETWHGKQLGYLEKLCTPWLMLGLLAMGASMLLWLLVLRTLPLHIAYPMLSLNYVLVALASRWWFGEHISGRAWLGMMCIVGGVMLIGAHL